MLSKIKSWLWPELMVYVKRECTDEVLLPLSFRTRFFTKNIKIHLV